MPVATRTKPRPFIKWVGGKTKLLPELTKRLPTRSQWTGRYYEPFIGGGALFFSLNTKGAILSDINPELINLYRILQVVPNAIFEALQTHERSHCKEHFYKVRSLDREEGWPENISKVERAARFIYLNKSGFNGLYRVNLKGQNNVPMGSYKTLSLPSLEHLSTCCEHLYTVKVISQPYSEIDAASGDFVYLDPPYIPLNPTSSFTSYAKEGFGLQQQRELAEFLVELDNRGCKWMLSNSSAPLSFELYQRWNIDTVECDRSINSKGSDRGAVKEVLVRNYA